MTTKIVQLQDLQPLYVSPMPHPYSWTPTQIADATFPVTEARLRGQDVKVGDTYGSGIVTGLHFYTGFAGCPARYYVCTTQGDYSINA